VDTGGETKVAGLVTLLLLELFPYAIAKGVQFDSRM
jgi:uncharacterized membrane protein YjgN (DUF898 family)